MTDTTCTCNYDDRGAALPGPGGDGVREHDPKCPVHNHEHDHFDEDGYCTVAEDCKFNILVQNRPAEDTHNTHFATLDKILDDMWNYNHTTGLVNSNGRKDIQALIKQARLDGYNDGFNDALADRKGEA